MGMDRAYRDRYLKMLDIMSGISPNDPMVLAALGTKAFLDGTANGNQVAIDRLTKAVDSGFTGPAAFEHLAEALAKDGRTTEAIKILQCGIELSPYEPRLHKFLMVQFINAQRYDLVKSEMQHYLELFPEDGFVRDLLRKSGG
jgi:predicted Zn-dependent protease